MNGVAILRAIKGVVAGELGATRTVTGPGGQPLCQYSPAVLEATDEHPIERFAFFTKAHYFDLQISPMRDHASTSQSNNTNQVHKLLDVAVVGVTSGGKGEDLSIDMQGEALDVTHAIATALGYRGNLTLDDRNQQTAIVGGCLIGPGGAKGNPVVVMGKRVCHLLSWRVTGSAILDLSQAVS